MSQRTERDPRTGKRVLRFVATTAVVVAPLSMVACGGAKHTPEHVSVEEHTNVAHEVDPPTNVGPEKAPEEAAPEKTNVDHTGDPHTNVGPEKEGDGGGDDASPK